MWKNTLKAKLMCFNCRKMFRLAADHPLEPAPVCPQCAQPMHLVGRFFRPPRTNDVRRWRVAEALYRSGVRYDGYAGRIPTHASGIKSYLDQHEDMRKFEKRK